MAKKKPAAGVAETPQERLSELAKLYMRIATDEAAVQELYRQYPQIYRDFFWSLAQEVFQKNPRLLSFSWRQYIPSFNDGDACTFTVNTDYPNINGLSEYDSYKNEKDEVFVDSPLTPLEVEQLRQTVAWFLGIYQHHLEQWFGANVEVTVRRDGGITTHEYYD